VSAASPLLAQRLAQLVPQAQARAAFGQACVHVTLGQWRRAAAAARDELGATMFDWLGAQDAGRPGASGERHTVLLHVVHPAQRCGVLMSTEVVGGDMLPSVAGIWAGAAWHEREAAEMFGLVLDGHPDPRRLLLPESFAGHPLRKDFVLASRVVRPWPGALEPGKPQAPGRRRLAPPGVPDPEWGPRRETCSQGRAIDGEDGS
jgi:NADH:ubiquinone oxidoreductase subunit C